MTKKSSITTDDLIAVNLRYEAGSEALQIRALSQIAAKILYANGTNVLVDRSEISKKCQKIFNIKNISKTSIDNALHYLENQLIAQAYGKKWMLSNKGFEQIKDDVQRASSRTRNILERHFPQRIEYEKLVAWFRDACTCFYEIYGNQWAATLGRKRSNKFLTAQTVSALLRDITRRHSLKHEEDLLIRGFHNFITSQENNDIEHKWSLGQSLLSSRLVAADIGPDPITTEDFRDSL